MCSSAAKSQIPLRYLVADNSEAGRRPAASRNLPYHYLASSELARASRSEISLGPVCDQDSVMEFGFYQLRTGLRQGSNRSELSRHVEIARTWSNLVADRFEAKFHYAILVADRSEADLRPASSC